MKTKEERANEHYPKQRVFNATYRDGLIDGKREGYIKGATEQEAITKKEMVEKILKWVEKNELPVNASETDDTIVGYSIMTDELIEYLKALEAER